MQYQTFSTRALHKKGQVLVCRNYECVEFGELLLILIENDSFLKLLRTAYYHLWKPHLPNGCHVSLFHPEVHHQPPPAAQDLTHSGRTTLKFHGLNFLRK